MTLEKEIELCAWVEIFERHNDYTNHFEYRDCTGYDVDCPVHPNYIPTNIFKFDLKGGVKNDL